MEDRRMKQQQFIHVSNLGYAAWYFTRTYRTKCDSIRVMTNVTEEEPRGVREEPMLECKLKFASWSHSGWELQVGKESGGENEKITEKTQTSKEIFRFRLRSIWMGLKTSFTLSHCESDKYT